MDFKTLYPKCIQAAKKHYVDLPYHNFPHALQVAERAYQIGELLKMNELEKFILHYAGLNHDKGYHLPLDKLLYSLKEDLSIALMKEESEILFNEYGQEIKDKIINGAEQAINGTKIEWTDFSSENAKILRTADIEKLGTPNIEEFLIGSAKIYHEHTFLNQEYLEKEGLLPIPQRIFQWKQTEILDTILHNCIKYIPEQPYLPFGFYVQFAKNIETLRNIDDFQQYIDQTAA